MTEEKEKEQKQAGASANEAWAEVGQRFQSLGESLATAFKSTWENKETQAQWEKVKADMEAAANDIGRAAKETAASAEAQQAKAEAKRTAQAAQQAGQEAFRDIKPHVLAAFRKIRSELDQAIENMERSDQNPAETSSNQASEE